MSVFIVIYCTLIFTYFSVKTRQLAEDKQKDFLTKGLEYIIVPMLLIAFITQSFAIGYLLYYTKKQQTQIMAAQSQQQQENTAVFSKESKRLATILIIFDCTYLLRAVWDATRFGLSQDPFAVSVFSISLGFFFDVIPIGLVLLFHYRNFSVAEVEQIPSSENTSPRSEYRQPIKLGDKSPRIDTAMNLSIEERRESNANQSHVSVNFLICNDNDSMASQFD